jgi:hypothetical protein
VKSAKRGEIVKNGKNTLLYKTQEEIFWLKCSLKLLKLLFLAGKFTKKNYFQLSLKKMMSKIIKTSKKE